MSHKNDTDHTRAGKISKTSTLNREISVFPLVAWLCAIFLWFHISANIVYHIKIQTVTYAVRCFMVYHIRSWSAPFCVRSFMLLNERTELMTGENLFDSTGYALERSKDRTNVIPNVFFKKCAPYGIVFVSP